MAGKVGVKVNDKFYFVMDEVDCPSDCESEPAADNDLKSAKSNTNGDNVTNTNNFFEGEDTKSNSNKNKNPDKEEAMNCTNQEESISQDSCLAEKKETSERIDSTNVEDNSFLKRKNEINFLDSRTQHHLSDMDIDSEEECVESVKPLLKITFRDEIAAQRLKPSIFEFISLTFDDCILATNKENSLQLEIFEKDTKNLPEHDLLDFNLDTTPGDNHLGVPDYGKSHDIVLSGDKKVIEKQNSEKILPSNTSCFNCLGNHTLKDCPKSKDFRVINKNRIKFQSQKEKAPKTRYHLDDNQKFGHLIPGVISKKLRNALNLKRDQQPGFIYKMRLLGYPPAWLEEAKVCHSGVVIYDNKGIPVLEEDEEEGEIVSEGAKDKFDISKIIEFPGFNVPLPSNFKDESKFYHCPGLSEDQSKENLIKLLEPRTVQAYVKKSLSGQKPDEKCLPQNNLKRVASPTIEEMEEKKRQLIMDLNTEDSSTEPKECFEGPSASLESVFPEKATESSEVGTVKNLEFGTPILKSVSPFAKLPSREQFSCNVSDVINFENLPNSTGKYETIKEVISKIRVSTLKNLKDK